MSVFNHREKKEINDNDLLIFYSADTNKIIVRRIKKSNLLSYQNLPDIIKNAISEDGAIETPSGQDITSTANLILKGWLHFYDSGGSVTMHRLSNGIIRMNDYGHDYTIQEIRAGGDVTADDLETTLTLQRNNDAGTNAEFLDLFNNGYHSTSDLEMGVRIQKRGTGNYRDFVIQYGDGTTVTDILRVDVDDSFTVNVLSDLSMNSNNITELADPINNQDATTKSWVESKIKEYITRRNVLGLSPMKQMSFMETTTNTFSNVDYPSGKNYGSCIEYYSGKYTRLYFAFRSNANPTTARVGYYDYDTQTFSSTTEIFSTTSNDGHIQPAITVSNDGYIIVAMVQDSDSSMEIQVSDSPEDISSFSQKSVISGTLDYPSFTKTGKKIFLHSRHNFNTRQISISEDSGQNWKDLSGNSNNKTKILELDETYHWAYSHYMNNAIDNGMFLGVDINNDNNNPSNNYNNHPIFFLIWSPDGQNWGNLEYYATNGEGGFSKDIVNDGYITEIEAETNCAIYWPDNPYTTTVSIWRQGMCVCPNGDVAITLARGTHEDTTYTITHLRTYIYDVFNKSLSYNEITVGNSGDDIPDFITDENIQNGVLLPCGESSNALELITKIDDGTYNQIWRYRTNDAGANWYKVEEITSASKNYQKINSTLQFMKNGGEVIVSDNDSDNDILFIKFDKEYRKP